MLLEKHQTGAKLQVDTRDEGFPLKCRIHHAALKAEAAMFTFIVSPVGSAHQSDDSRKDKTEELCSASSQGS